jgi:dTDP-4-dehydrorhamnose 3,5-epimerase
MIFTATALAGAYIIESELRRDARGYFTRLFCRREFEEHGLDPVVAQVSVAFNARKGTIRGLHFQYPPAAEAKVVRCTRGALLDVIVDLRPESATYLRHLAVRLCGDTYRALYVPPRFAHGYQVLEDDTEAEYHISEFWAPDLSAGLRYDDPRLSLEWMLDVTCISAKDSTWPLIDDCEPELRRRMLASAPASVA